MKTLRENLLLQFSLASLLMVAVLAVALAGFIGQVVAVHVLQEAERRALEDVSPRALRRLAPEDFAQPMHGERYEAFHRFMADTLVSSRIARIKIWGRDGRVLFSTDPDQVGEAFPLSPGLERALRGETSGTIAVPGGHDNQEERHLGTLIEVYTPAIFPGSREVVGAIEVYEYYAPYAHLIDGIRRSTSLVIGLGAALLYGVLFLIVRRGWRTIGAQQGEIHRRLQEGQRLNAQLRGEIAERHRAEAALQHARDELELRVRERTAELVQASEGLQAEVAERRLAETALQRAKEEAERANRAKSDFLSRMSHELRTPLNAILGFGQLLEMDALGPDHRESVAQILRAGRHLLALINEVLDLARIEAGRLGLSPEPVPARDVALEALALLQPLAADRRVHCAAAPPWPAAWHVLADRQRLKQILLNLLSNAVKYNREGGTVTLSCTAAAPGRLRLQVLDTGPGLPPEQLARLFTPFERLGAEQTAVEGTGLGLALSKRLAEAMGGAMGVESTVGQGSTFWVELALAESPAERWERTGRGTAPTQQAATPPAPARTLLYIEDNLSNLRLMERLVARQPDLRLLPAMQGQLGLDLAREHRPDLILLDLHLPDLAGAEVLARLRAAPETQAIPVVVISADATAGQIARLRAAGARAYLTKPLDVHQFLAVVEEALRDGAAGAAAPAAARR